MELYRADSDILSFLISILIMGLGAYNTFVTSKKKQKREKMKEQRGEKMREQGGESRQEESVVVEMQEVSTENDQPFFSQRPWHDLVDVEAAGEFNAEVVQEPKMAAEQIEERVVADFSRFARIVPEEVKVEPVVVNEVPEKGEALSKRLKRSPKDMIIFAEILNPKFKEL